MGKRRRSTSRPLRPTASMSNSLSGPASMNWLAAFTMLALNAPANPRSPLTTTSSTRFSSRVAKQRMAQVAGLRIDDLDAPRQRLQHAGDHLRVGPRRHRALLRAAQPGRRDHLHGLGDLARVLYAADAPSKIEYVRHCSVLSSQFTVLSSQWLVRSSGSPRHYCEL